jgi:hypothetical protein
MPLQRPRTVKYQPLPAAPISGCRSAAPEAAIEQRVMLVAAAALLRLRGNKSTIKLLYVV